VAFEADVDPQPARQQVAELLAGVAHEAALVGGAGAGLVLDLEELDAGERPGGQPGPQDPGLQLDRFVLAGALQREVPAVATGDGHLGGRRAVVAGQQPVDRQPEQVDDVEQLAHRRLGLAGLDLGERAGADPQAPGHLAQPEALAEPLGADQAAQVEGGSVGQGPGPGGLLVAGRGHAGSVQSATHCSAPLDAR
jgi:hypothetical protein